jgi:hypothetical protein
VFADKTLCKYRHFYLHTHSTSQMSCLRTLVYYSVVHCVVSVNTCVLLRCSVCRVCELLCITTLFIMSCLRRLVYYYVVHYVVSANTCVLLHCSLCRDDIMNNGEIHKCSQTKHFANTGIFTYILILLVSNQGRKINI